MTLQQCFTAEFLGLPAGQVLPQEQVQAALTLGLREHTLIEPALDALESWLKSIGYFAHLREDNLFLAFPNAWQGCELWLQVNYSRLGYKLPPGPRTQKCPLCYENIGAPGKELLRVFEFELAGTPYFAHPTPFPLHPGHFVLNAREHSPMRVNGQSLREAHAFLQRAPGWLLASNSDVEWAGASVLGHHHFQVFRGLTLPVEHAPALATRDQKGIRTEWLNWPATTIRLQGAAANVLAYAEEIIAAWKAKDPGRCTGNYLMRLNGADELTITFFFRHPAFVTAPELRHIKSEGVGIVEMAGESIVPPRPDLDRDGNRAFFEQVGRDFTIALIRSNSPPACAEGGWDIPALLQFSPLDISKISGKEVKLP